ncbi:MAG: ATP synthase subunit I [Lamprobacter sp.]|uniref:ATP synthase subunit I n=1 Tax=Lamprobacter sp. TaxID=3100796 RepID=UPI002B25FA29|nr:ATP synthase subunit I [Lamprobacter sp.]MEA3638714.1 ATP synthase subunit I [Lamprobacter sp.]
MLVWQVVVTVVVVLVAFWFGLDALYSAAVGAGACLLSNWYFAYRVFQRYQAREPGQLLARIYGAEFAKIAIALAVFGLAFALLDQLRPLALFGAYLAVQWVPAVLAQRPDARSNS